MSDSAAFKLVRGCQYLVRPIRVVRRNYDHLEAKPQSLDPHSFGVVNVKIDFKGRGVLTWQVVVGIPPSKTVMNGLIDYGSNRDSIGT